MTGLGGTEGTDEGLDAGVCAMWAMAVGSGGKSRQAGGSRVPSTGWSSQWTDLPQVLRMNQHPLIGPTSLHRARPATTTRLRLGRITLILDLTWRTHSCLAQGTKPL